MNRVMRRDPAGAASIARLARMFAENLDNTCSDGRFNCCPGPPNTATVLPVDWKFYPMSDATGKDVMHHTNGQIQVRIAECAENGVCNAVNSLGYVKKGVTEAELVDVEWEGSCQGTYSLPTVDEEES